MAGFALLLPFLSWPRAAACAVAAFLFNLLVLPRLMGHRLSSRRAGVSDVGVLLYPVVVLGMILVFRRDLAYAAVGWGFLAWGDAAAGVVGMKWGSKPLPWNPGKSWEGLAGGVAGAWIAGAALLTFSLSNPLREPLAAGGATAWLVGSVLAGAVVFGLVESAELALDDNLLAPVLGAVVVWALARPTVAAGAAVPAWPRWQTDWEGWVLALAVNGACAALAGGKRVLTAPGIAAAWVLGMVAWGFGGVRLWIVLLVFLAAGTLVTRIGWQRKAALGIAEGDRGRRGFGNVVSKGAVVFGAGLLTPFADGGLLAVAATAALAGALADTAGSEIGKAFGRRTYLLPTLRPATPGTPGAVSVPGTLATAAGAAAIASLATGVGLLEPRRAVLAGGVGFLAAMLESGLPRRVAHDAVNLTLTLVAAGLAAGGAILLGW